MNKPRLDEIFELRGPGELSGQDRFQGGLAYRAEYRSKSGFWTKTRDFRATDDLQALTIARAFLERHPRKPRDTDWLTLRKVWCLDPQETP